MEKNNKKYAVILGARPNFVKAAPFFKEAKKFPHLEFVLIHTGQHFDEKMSKVFFEQMDIPIPDINLSIGNLDDRIKFSQTFQLLKKTLRDIKGLDGVIVFGDVMSTLAGSLAAKILGIKLFHIESGLRSFDKRMPEETNRVIVDNISDVLFVSEPEALKNLKSEGIDHQDIYMVGNIMIDALEKFKEFISDSEIKKLGLDVTDYVVVTIHRLENINDPLQLESILKLIRQINISTKVVFPLHPGTKNKISSFFLDSYLDNILTIEPLSYFDFISLVSRAKGVLTDSGGIQEETSHLGIPCATLRDNTERPITLTEGTNKLFSFTGKDFDILVKEIIEHLSQKKECNKIPYWDDKVSNRILNYL